MKKIVLILLSGLLLLILLSCKRDGLQELQKPTFLTLLALITNDKSTYPPIDQKKIILTHYAIYGLLPVAKTYTVTALMKSDTDRSKTDRTFVNGLLSAMTLSIYTPNKEFVNSDVLL